MLREVQGVLADVQQAWFETTSAVQVASMRAAIAQAARLSAELAQRFFDAGNKSELDLAMERSAAAQASVSRLRAEAAATQSRLQLQRLMGLRGALAFQLDAQLPLPPTASLDADAARRLAMEQRFDLLAARRNIELHEAALGLARRWRWLGHVTIGAERERETSGSSSRSGPTLELALPIFDQGQAGIEAAAARLDMSRAALRDLEGAVEHEVESSLARVAASKQVVEEYSKTLVPAQQAIVERQQQRQNFMFIGQFELLLAKQQEYDVYQSYLEAVRDYWLARIEFARATGSALPGGESAAAPRIGVENMLGAAMEEQR